jgi:diguanylate cyclase (GGDEF)-like protein/PAS domain S-box-containing protein
MSNELHILLIEDNPGDVRIIKELLREAKDRVYIIDQAGTLKAGLEILLSSAIDVIMLDLNLPDFCDIDSLESVITLVGDVPVIIMTGLEDETTAINAVKSGAQDYLVKGQVGRRLLLRSIHYSIARKKAEVQLRASETRARAISDSSLDGIIVMDGDGVITYFNKAAERVFGYAEHEVLGRKLHDMMVSEEARLQYYRKLPVFSETGQCEVIGKTLELTGTKKDGSNFPLELSVSSFRINNKWHSAGTVRDITRRKQLEEQLRMTAVTDDLTGLFNRRGFFRLAEQQCKLADRTKRRMSLLYIDLNDMKTINDTLGHDAGDRALIDSAAILKKTFRESDILARIGGDEFAVLLTEHSDVDIDSIVIGNLRTSTGIFNRGNKRDYTISFSIGSAHFDPANPCSTGDLLLRADAAMYKDKKQYHEQRLKNTSWKETRSHPRIGVTNGYRAALGGKNGAIVKNISLGGICLETPEIVSPDSEYEIKIVTPENETLHPRGKVVWSRQVNNGNGKYSYETGLEFIRLDADLENSLVKLISGLTVGR